MSWQVVNQVPTSIQVFREGIQAPPLHAANPGELEGSNREESDQFSMPSYSGSPNPFGTNSSPVSSIGSLASSINMEKPPSEPPSLPFSSSQTLDNFPTSPIDAASDTLLSELRKVTDVEDLSGRFDHTHRKLVARGGYSEVCTTHLRDDIESNLIQVGFQPSSTLPFLISRTGLLQGPSTAGD